MFNIPHILIGLTIGICLAFAFGELRFTKPWMNWYSSNKLKSTEDHLSWLSWHKVQMNNPLSKYESQVHVDHEAEHAHYQPPTLKEEIKKIINNNKLKLDNFNIIHSNDEL
ncbi:hypothetical protein PCANC_15443 [Puccinia coronata f. sp. avenae]|uniref:Uncharacterized protein n=1 Tax=Puccinia coronata f. sp. avenae TaxID=200324 RepID=A0A2N5SEC2_9BASI|nr:hypothetical protein PCANC_20434 [Puccinia coronata f. sp. avenae]PLW33373.1 hypothetical protein PCASD_13027 [Puccinia coronata f. sp. avenae]PLW37296.1 hypothetical protein PCANC_15443 [Puccinia coronata f. sp. avenae]